MLKLTYKTTHF